MQASHTITGTVSPTRNTVIAVTAAAMPLAISPWSLTLWISVISSARSCGGGVLAPDSVERVAAIKVKSEVDSVGGDTQARQPVSHEQTPTTLTKHAAQIILPQWLRRLRQ